jgi:GDP-L-fucose synthase
VKTHRVLVTGGNGFLGQNVCDQLRIQPWVQEVLAPRSSVCDLRDAQQVAALFRTTQPDVVIHLAATVGGIGANQQHPALFFRENMLMGMNTMHEAYANGIKKFVCIGTICAYPKHTPVPFREEELWNGYPEETNAPYGIAKKALLTMAQAYRQEYGWNAIYLLPVNLYGPGDNFDLETSHVIPALIRKFVEAKERGDASVTLWGDGSATREFLYVGDAASAIVRATERYDGGDPVNIGTGREITIQDLAALIASAAGFAGEIVWDSRKPNGQPRRCVDTKRATEAFGFTATTQLEAGIRTTVDWFQEQKGPLREVHFSKR